MTKDPVCGMQVDEHKAPATTTYQGQKYSFCGQECKDKFDREPKRYAHSGPTAQAGQSSHQGASHQGATQQGQSGQRAQSNQPKEGEKQHQKEPAHR